MGAGPFGVGVSPARVTLLPSWFRLPRKPPYPLPASPPHLRAPRTRWVAGGGPHLGFLCRVPEHRHMAPLWGPCSAPHVLRGHTRQGLLLLPRPAPTRGPALSRCLGPGGRCVDSLWAALHCAELEGPAFPELRELGGSGVDRSSTGVKVGNCSEWLVGVNCVGCLGGPVGSPDLGESEFVPFPWFWDVLRRVPLARSVSVTCPEVLEEFHCQPGPAWDRSDFWAIGMRTILQ